LTVSLLPARSVAKYLRVAEAGILIALLYTLERVVGVEPSVE
jgi:hypothetical protein